MGYVERVAKELDGRKAVSVGLCPGCSFCADTFGMDQNIFDEALENGEICDGPSFSKDACDACGSPLGGDRHAGHYILPDKNGSVVGQDIQHMEVCSDCLCYIANGDVPEEMEAIHGG